MCCRRNSKEPPNSFSVTCCLFGSRTSTFLSMHGGCWAPAGRHLRGWKCPQVHPPSAENFTYTQVWILWVNWYVNSFLKESKSDHFLLLVGVSKLQAWILSPPGIASPQHCCQSISSYPKLLRTVGLCCEKAINLGKDLIFLLFPSWCKIWKEEADKISFLFF